MRVLPRLGPPNLSSHLRLLQAKIVVRQSPLTKDALEKLENFICDDSTDPELRQVAGYAVFLPHSRSCFSDALRQPNVFLTPPLKGMASLRLTQKSLRPLRR
eukprot:295946-Amphidinium_carterae.1